MERKEVRWWKGICILGMFAFLIASTQAIDITEITVTETQIKITITNATSSGYIFVSPSNKSFPYAYSHQGNGTYTITATFLKPNSTYYVKVCDSESCSNVVSVNVSKEEKLVEQNFTAPFNNLMQGGNLLNISKLGETIPSVYTSLLTDMFWAMFFGGIFLTYWIRQEDVMLPSIVGLITGSVLIVMLPPSAQHIAYILLVVSIAGTLYTIIKARR